MSFSLTQPGSFVVGCNYWASHAGTRMWADWQPETVAADLQQLAESGLQMLRVFPLWPDFQPLIMLRGAGGKAREYRILGPDGEQPMPDTPAGQAGVSEEALRRFAAFADLVYANGLKLIVGLVTGWMSGRLFVPPALEGLNVLTDPVAIQWETRFVRCFVRRFKDHPAIAAWDLGNECNCMAPVPNPEAAWSWVSAITNAIRAEDPGAGSQGRPIVSGMHGMLDQWSPATMGELTDLLTTHPYPYWTVHCDQDPVTTIRTLLHSTAETRLYADWGGKPCLAEEVGTLGPMLGSDAVAADFIRSCLLSLWAHDGHGLLWWCAYDQDRLEHAPYDWNTCERELGLIRADRTAKPVLSELGQFHRFLDSLPIQNLPVHKHEAVCLLSQDQDQWGAAYSTFVLARQAGFDLEFQQGEQPLKEAALYLVPSVRGINIISRRRWLALLERVRAGATLYLSLEEALLAGVPETFGVEVRARGHRPEPWGDFSIPGVGDFHIPASIRLNLRSTGAEVLGCEPDGSPAFTRFAYGAGEVYLLTVPLESALANWPGAFHTPETQPFWKIYRHIAEKHLADRAARKQHALLGLTEHPLNERERVLVAVNYSPETLTDTLELAPGWQIQANWGTQTCARGTLQGNTLTIPPNDGAVLLISR